MTASRGNRPGQGLRAQRGGGGLGRKFLAGLIAGAALGGLWALFDRGIYRIADVGWYALIPAVALGLVFVLVAWLLKRPGS